MILPSLLALCVMSVPAAAGSNASSGIMGHYEVLTCRVDVPPPFTSVAFTTGPREGNATWWELSIQKNDEANGQPLLQVRALTSRNPLTDTAEPIRFDRYLVRIPAERETFEYRNVHTNAALLPGWGGFREHFVPQPARGTARNNNLPETANYLGHVLSLRTVRTDASWEVWNDLTVLNLDPELLVGTARGFKDKEGHRLPKTSTNQDYTYVPFTPDDYRVMFDAGFNIFCVEPGEPERIVRTHPAYYIRGLGAGKTVLQYPADLYRSNYLGPVMFMDEPTILLMADKSLQDRVWHFSDAAAAIERRVRALYNSTEDYGRYALERPNEGKRLNTGDMRLDQYDFPSWETIYETAFYQMAGGCNGIAHEGRYQLADFDEAVARFTHQQTQLTPEQLLKYYYAFLRGGTRPFNKHWGTAIYGQCDPVIAPKALTLAYDMGARYLWFWTSDHDHHVPWVEQVELARTLRKHASEHPRGSIFGPRLTLDTVIVLPYGCIASLEEPGWVHILRDEKTRDQAVKRYHQLMQRVLTAVEKAWERSEDFDITIDDGREITGYKNIVRIVETP